MLAAQLNTYLPVARDSARLNCTSSEDSMTYLGFALAAPLPNLTVLAPRIRQRHRS